MWNQLILFSILIFITKVYCRIEVNIVQGVVQGRSLKSQRGRTFHAFTGIPYAKPPLEKLRFRPPVPVDPWEGVLDATRSHNPCPQADYFAENFTLIGNEDCLYLNVYKPKRSVELPVMFYIHGGSFDIGCGDIQWIGPEILLDRDVVLVVINYRLGPFGFLSTEDEEQPGNNGLKDQALALQWVQENIVKFGGDPKNVTLFGNSAGAMSVHYLLMSPLTKGLFHKVIIQSGTATTVSARKTKGAAKSSAVKLGQLCNCLESTTVELVNCLRKANVTNIIEQARVISSFNSDVLFMPFGPVVEGNKLGAFIVDDPITSMKYENFSNIPMLIGVVEDEGAFRTAQINSQPGLLETINKDFTSFAANSFGIVENVSETTEGLRKFYFGNKTIDKSSIEELTKLFSDGWFLSSLDASLYLLLKYKYSEQNVYLFVFGYRGSTSYTALYGDSTTDYGVCHTDELLYLLPRHHSFREYKPTEADKRMADSLSKMWVDFATTGNPTPDTHLWETVQNKRLQYLHIKGANSLVMDEDMFSNRQAYWRENIHASSWKKIKSRRY